MNHKIISFAHQKGYDLNDSQMQELLKFYHFGVMTFPNGSDQRLFHQIITDFERESTEEIDD